MLKINIDALGRALARLALGRWPGAGARASVHTLYDSPPIEAYQSDDIGVLASRLALYLPGA